ncbi:MAG: hypothetical protein ACRERU_11705 [Methylococcales bacterium]
MRNTVLFQNGRHVGFGDVIGEGAVTEEHLAFVRGFQFLVPVNYTL